MKKNKNEKIEIWLTITDENGKVEIHKRANSFVRGFIDLLYGFVTQATVANGWKDTGGTDRNTAVASSNMAMNSGATITTFGIVVGTDATAVAIGNNSLGNLITDGIGAGNLQYGANSNVSPITSGTSRQFTLSRTLTNGSPGAVTVNEVGIYGKAGTTPWYVMWERTLSTFTINAGASKTVTYTIKVTV